MHSGVVVAFLLGLAGVLQAVPLTTDPLYPTQENFDLDRFLGKWHDIAEASNCPWVKRQRDRGEKAIGLLKLKSSSEGKIAMTRQVLRHGTCDQILGEYELTSTPGRFSYHLPKWGASVDAYVVHTVYDEYAIVLMSVQQGGNAVTTTIRLYSRTMTVRPTVMEDFKSLAREQGLSDDMITIKMDKGECTPGEMPAVEPVVQRSRRNVVLPMAPEEGSGDETPMFGAEACKMAPEVGPCFGMLQRYFYNSSSMSCQLFSYGGCAGNQNNFLTERDCLQKCRTEAACRLPMAARPCSGQLPVWAFEAASGKCLAYKTGFCQDNGNKFYSKNECEEYCGVMKEGEGEFLKAN